VVYSIAKSKVFCLAIGIAPGGKVADKGFQHLVFAIVFHPNPAYAGLYLLPNSIPAVQVSDTTKAQ
jgi:hypothetical protein